MNYFHRRIWKRFEFAFDIQIWFPLPAICITNTGVGVMWLCFGLAVDWS